MDRQGVAPGLRLRRGAVGRGFGCGSGRLGINVHRELETDLCRGPWFEFLDRLHHDGGAGRPFVALDDPQDPAHQATIASGAENAVRTFRPVVCLLSAPLARRLESLPPRRRSSINSSEVILDRGCAPQAAQRTSRSALASSVAERSCDIGGAHGGARAERLRLGPP